MMPRVTVPDLIEMREGIRRRAGLRVKGPELASVEDLAGPGGIALRRYRPSAGRRPLVVYLHGGAWVIGDLGTHDRACRRIALACDVEVLAVDYRLAPEHPYPAAVDDAVEVLRSFEADAVAGDSAGGYLATMACLRLRDEGGVLPAVQVLICPNTDLTSSQPSIEEKGTGYALDSDFVAWSAAQWVPDPVLRADPRVSPMLVPDLRGMPSTLIVTAEHDALRDEGNVYARRLAEAGVPVVHREEAGLTHGFVQNADPESEAAADRLFADLSRLLAAR